jgi:hypothetical protein
VAQIRQRLNHLEVRLEAAEEALHATYRLIVEGRMKAAIEVPHPAGHN